MGYEFLSSQGCIPNWFDFGVGLNVHRKSRFGSCAADIATGILMNRSQQFKFIENRDPRIEITSEGDQLTTSRQVPGEGISA
jgi:hypothetical protein